MNGREAAMRLKVSADTVYKAISKGLLKASMKDNGRYEIMGSDLIRYWRHKIWR